MNLSTKTQSIWLSCDPIDFRESIDGLCEVVQSQFDMLPHQGIFIFLNNARNRVKILLWHTNGFMLIYKRFETGKLVMMVTLHTYLRKLFELAPQVRRGERSAKVLLAQFLKSSL